MSPRIRNDEQDQTSRTRSEAEVVAILKELKHANDAVTAEESQKNKIERFLKWAYAFGGVIAMVVSWQTKIQIETASHDEEIKVLKAAVETARVDREANTKIFTQIDARISANSKLLDDRKVDIDHVREMWFMKEHGISNKEDFEQKKGYPPPSKPTP